MAIDFRAFLERYRGRRNVSDLGEPGGLSARPREILVDSESANATFEHGVEPTMNIAEENLPVQDGAGTDAQDGSAPGDAVRGRGRAGGPVRVCRATRR